MRDGLLRDDDAGCARRRHDDVRVLELGADRVECKRLRSQLPCQVLAVSERPVRDDGDLRPARDEVARGRLAHLARAEQHDPPTGEVAEHLLRERGGRRRNGRRALADRGLDPDAAAGVQRLAEEVVEQRPGRAGFERAPHLPEDLALAGNQRIEPGGDTEEMQRRRAVPQPVQRGGEIIPAVTGELRHCSDGLFLRVLLPREVELGAVARRQHDCLAAETVGQLLGERPARVEVERNALPQLDRCAVVRDADEHERSHEAKWVSGRTTATSAKPARLTSAARRPRHPSWRTTSRDA